MKVARKHLLQAAGILIVIVPVLVVVCRSPEPPSPAPAGSGRRNEPAPDPTAVLRRDVLDPATRAEGERMLQRMRLKWRLDYEYSLKNPGCGYTPPGRFVNEWLSHKTEVRLLSLGYPEVAEEWAKSVTGRPDTPMWDHYQAQVALGVLWSDGWTSAGSDLVEVHRRARPNTYDASLFFLISGDREGKYRAWYRELVRQGDWHALDALAIWNEPEAESILADALDRLRKQSQPDYIVHYLTEKISPRIRALESGEWPGLVRKILLEEPAAHTSEQFAWALRIAFDRRPAGLEGVLRQRIAQAYQEGAVGVHNGRPYSRDAAYDDVLLLLARIGGTLNAQEKSYLQYFGYGVEPRVRLIDVLEAQGYPH